MRKSTLIAATLMGCTALLACKPDAKGSVMDNMADKEAASASTENATQDTSNMPPPSMDAAENLKAANAFLATNKTAKGVQTTASGLQYVVIASGAPDQPKPTAESVVQVNYEGKLLTGQVFDSSFARGQAAEFPVGALIPAWVEALQLMRPGDEWTIWVPPSIGYGEAGAPGAIPPNALLIFRMRLEKIVGGPTSAADIEAEKGATK